MNASFARKYWGNQSALGHQVRIFNPGQAAAVAHHRRRRARHVDAGSVRSANRERRILHAAARRVAGHAVCTIVVRPRAGQRADTLGPVLSKAVAELDSNLPTYFAGTPARFHDEILSGNRVIATLFTIFGIVAFILSARRPLRRDEFLGQSTHAGVRHSHGAGRGCRANFAHGDDPGRVATRASVLFSARAALRCSSASSRRPR